MRRLWQILTCRSRRQGRLIREWFYGENGVSPL